MSELNIICPHCGKKFNVLVDGPISNMMVFSCVTCKTPLIHYYGETLELDNEEFVNLRKRLTKVIDIAISQNKISENIASPLKDMIETSNAISENRSVKRQITDEDLKLLEKKLSEMDVDTFLDNI